MPPSGTVTFLFTNIEGSTRLWQEMPEAMSFAHARHDAILRDAIESNHGYVFQIVGDSFSTALAAQHKLQKEPSGETAVIKVRMGLHAGAAEALRERIDSIMTDSERVECDQAVVQLHSMVTETDFHSLWTEGRSMTMEEAIELVLQEPH